MHTRPPGRTYAKLIEKRGWTYYHTKNLIGAADGEEWPMVCPDSRRQVCERTPKGCQNDPENASRNLKNCRSVLLQRYILVRGGDNDYLKALYDEEHG